MNTTNPTQITVNLEAHFEKFRENTLGRNIEIDTICGKKPLIYTDWIAEGRMYGPIEDRLKEMAAYVANPHSYSSYTGQNITTIYKEARQIIKDHVNATEDDVLITVGHGMTGAIERVIKLIAEKFEWNKLVAEGPKPVVFITHMEHHSNHTTWVQMGADVVILPAGENGLVDPEVLHEKLQDYKDRILKIGSFSGCSNVSGIVSPYHELAEVMHNNGGKCIVDFAASAPYVEMNMHPENPNQKLDAIVFAPHKFLGGPGTCGVAVMCSTLHPNKPAIIGGGNVKWTLPNGEFGVSPNLEMMEDAGTPGYIQTIKTALSIKLKEDMGIKNIHDREKELLDMAIDRLCTNPEVELVECENREVEKIGVVSFNIKDIHYNMVVRILNDKFGIQTRGGWSCASNYAYHVFKYSNESSTEFIDRMKGGNLTGKPGWVRLSLHPTMTNDELNYCLDAIEQIVENREDWSKEYYYDISDNECYPNDKSLEPVDPKEFFTL